MSASKTIAQFFIFGMGMFFLGGLYRLFNEGFVEDIVARWYITSDAMDLLIMLNRWIPMGIMVIGLFCMTLAGISARGGSFEYE